MGRRYELSEACEWFVDGAAAYYGFNMGDVEPDQTVRDAWDAWINVCDTLWVSALGVVDSCTGLTDCREMPEAFPTDYMHTHQGAGVGHWDLPRSYPLTETEVELLTERGGDSCNDGSGHLGARVAAAFRAFESAVDSCVYEARVARASAWIAPFAWEVLVWERRAPIMGPRSSGWREYRAALANLFAQLADREGDREGRYVDTDTTMWDLLEGVDLYELADAHG